MLTGQAKVDYQREYMRRRRSNAGSNREGLGSNSGFIANGSNTGLTEGGKGLTKKGVRSNRLAMGLTENTGEMGLTPRVIKAVEDVSVVLRSFSKAEQVR